MERKEINLTDMPADSITEEEAEQIGEQIGQLIAGLVLSNSVRRSITTAIEKMIEAPVLSLKVFEDALLNTLFQLLDPKTMEDRVKASTTLLQNSAVAQMTAADISVKAVKEGDLGAIHVIEGLLTTAEELRNASDGIFAPVKLNLENLIKDGRRIAAVQDLEEKAHLKDADKSHDCDCDDKDCCAHTNH